MVTKIFLGTNGLRAGWRLLIFLAVLISCLLGFREVVVHTPTLLRMVQPLREGRLVVSAALIAEFQFVLSLLVAVGVMSKIEGRSLGDYGLPARAAFGPYFWQGVAWGLLAVTGLMLLISASGGFSFGSLALHGRSLVAYGVGWAIVFLMVGFFEEFLFRGYVQFTLATAIGFWPSAILLSAAFGLAHSGGHGENWVGGATAGLFGLFLCFTLRRTGNLWFALGLHASFVYGETFIYSVPNSGFPSDGHLLNSTLHGPRWLTGGSVGPEASVMTFAVFALLFMLFGLYGPRSDWLRPALHMPSRYKMVPVDLQSQPGVAFPLKEVKAMARILGADPSKQGLLRGLFTRIVYAMTKRKVGRVVMPVQLVAHHPKLLWGYGQMEQSFASSHMVDAGLKDLAQLRIATLIGCPFWIDLGSAVSRKSGVSPEKIEALPKYRTSSLFAETEKLVLEYADAMTHTPVEVTDALFAKLREKFTDAQLVELTATLAWENYRARFDHAFGVESEGFTQGSYCALPAHAGSTWSIVKQKSEPAYLLVWDDKEWNYVIVS